ncbi:binding-protein-dependent transport systems inner membrane component [Streptomyces bingchenggensis BCW-1]|uniref:Binding-protein-dependent transport systems inner membrane component n=1 Tax=Streptomyces bingchenggensis (strain BCW-1) TaxID=749414 RepID=D7CBU7_STRBB|nr:MULTISPECIES: carbohydrate ABC transporter permease [Streptomyces]ADI04442.1 binding-protein-dependent transport systems inner membrane component [Streptomyces bingchenggensis BCW-1]
MTLAKRSAVYMVLVALLVLFLSPFGWLAITALKDVGELRALPIHWWPHHPSLGNFQEALTRIPYLAYARNSLTIATIYSVLVTLASAWAGYGFARLDAPGKRVIFGLLMSTMMLPAVITLIPTYLVFAKFNLLNTYMPWVLWGLCGAPYLIFLFRQFFSNMPKELEEAAIVDGCGHIRIFWRIFLPQSWPVIATSLILSFSWTWGDYIAPALLLDSDRTTLAVKLATGYVNEHGAQLSNLVAAGAVMYVVPVLVLFLIMQRGFVSGISTSGLK